MPCSRMNRREHPSTARTASWMRWRRARRTGRHTRSPFPRRAAAPLAAGSSYHLFISRAGACAARGASVGRPRRISAAFTAHGRPFPRPGSVSVQERRDQQGEQQKEAGGLVDHLPHGFGPCGRPARVPPLQPVLERAHGQDGQEEHQRAGEPLPREAYKAHARQEEAGQEVGQARRPYEPDRHQTTPDDRYAAAARSWRWRLLAPTALMALWAGMPIIARVGLSAQFPTMGALAGIWAGSLLEERLVRAERADGLGRQVRNCLCGLVLVFAVRFALQPPAGAHQSGVAPRGFKACTRRPWAAPPCSTPPPWSAGRRTTANHPPAGQTPPSP